MRQSHLRIVLGTGKIFLPNRQNTPGIAELRITVSADSMPEKQRGTYLHASWADYFPFEFLAVLSVEITRTLMKDQPKRLQTLKPNARACLLFSSKIERHGNALSVSISHLAG